MLSPSSKGLQGSRGLSFFSKFLIFLFIASVIFLYFPVLQRLVTVWSESEDYSHGFFIIPLSLFILWQKKDDLMSSPTCPSRWGIVLVILALLIYVFAHLGEIATIASFSMILLLVGITVYLFGFSFLKKVLFPILFLVFMIPVPSQVLSALTIPLQLLVSKISVNIAYFFGVPTYREGNVIHMAEHTLQVVQACSGLRSIISLLTLSVIIGYFSLKSNFLRVILLSSSVPVAIFVNILRVLIIIMSFYFFNYDISAGDSHTVFGVIIFVVGFGLLLLLRGVLSSCQQIFIKK